MDKRTQHHKKQEYKCSANISKNTKLFTNLGNVK